MNDDAADTTQDDPLAFSRHQEEPEPNEPNEPDPSEPEPGEPDPSEPDPSDRSHDDVDRSHDDVRLVRREVRNLGADVSNLFYRIQQIEGEASRERIFVWAEFGIILAILYLHSRALGKLAKAVNG